MQLYLMDAECWSHDSTMTSDIISWPRGWTRLSYFSLMPTHGLLTFTLWAVIYAMSQHHERESTIHLARR